jgi:hypothetical protein
LEWEHDAVAQNAKASNLIAWTLEPKNKQLSRLNCMKGRTAWLPEIYLSDMVLTFKEIEPIIIGVGNKQLNHVLVLSVPPLRGQMVAPSALSATPIFRQRERGDWERAL